MKKLICLVVLVVWLSGCVSAQERERTRVIGQGSFQEKVDYLEKNYASPPEIIEFLGPPDRKKHFFGGGSIWFYENTEEPLEILFGSTGRLLSIRVKYYSD